MESNRSRHLPIEETDLFKAFCSVADEIWNITMEWAWFPQSTVGKQLVRAIDSVGANLVEGDGRYTDADTIRFFIIAGGSAREATYWLERARIRGLIELEVCLSLIGRVNAASKALNAMITYRRKHSYSAVREELAPYGSRDLDAEDPITQ